MWAYKIIIMITPAQMEQSHCPYAWIRLPKQVLYSKLSEGKHAPGGQKKRYKDNIKTIIKKFHIDLKTWEDMTKNTATWRNLVHEGAALYNEELHHAAEHKCRLRKERASTKQAQPKPTTTFTCPHCTRIIGSRIGLYAHLKTHRDQEGGQPYSTTSDCRWWCKIIQLP